jgi:molecular chaperone DnaK (HSP70)
MHNRNSKPIGILQNLKRSKSKANFTRVEIFNQSTNSNSYSVGIDLGTTYSLVSILDEVSKSPRIVLVDGHRMLPSVVGLTFPDPPLVGYEAISQEAGNPNNTFSSIKRIIGRTVPEVLSLPPPSPHINIKNKWASSLLPPRSPLARCELRCSSLPANKSTISPEEVSSLIIKKLISAAQKQILANLQNNSRHKNSETIDNISQINIDKAVITVPAYFSTAQRDATVRLLSLNYQYRYILLFNVII